MVSDHQLNVVPVVPFSAQPRHAFGSPEQRFRRGATERTDRLWFDSLKLPVKELPADLHFVGLRRAILRGPALHHVADINVGALDREALFRPLAFDHLREQLSRAADEWQTLLIFIGAWALTNKHQPRLLVARSEHNLIASLVQAAARTVANVPEDGEQRILRRFDGR